MRVHVLTLLPLLAVQLAGCDQAVAPTVKATVQAGTVAANNGAVREEFDNIVFFLIYDAERQLLAAHMPSDICSAGGFNVVHVKRVLTPSAIGQRIAQLTSREETVSVYHAATLAEAGILSPGIDFLGFPDIVNLGTFCAFLEGPNLIAEGTVNRLTTFSFASFHGRWIGTIQGVDGREYRLTEVYQLNASVFDPNNPTTFTQPVSSIMLRPGQQP